MAETISRKLRYVGPHKAVEIPALETTVLRNHQIEVADADLAAGLLAQVDNWQEVGAASKGKQGADDPAGKEGS